MSDKPIALVKIDDLAANLRGTMARASDVFCPSMRKQLAQTVAAILRQRLTGVEFIHPGMSKMAKWGQCSERQARRNFSQLEDWGVFTRVAFPMGGRRSTRFVVDFGALKSLLVEMGTSPSAALCEKLSEAMWAGKNPDINPDIKGRENPDMRPDTMSAGIHIDGKAPSEGRLKPALRVVGGRDA